MTLEHHKPDMSDLTIRIDESKIISHGQPAVGSLLQKLQVYRSTADVDKGRELIESMTVVDSYFLRVRDVILKNRQMRKLFVQPNTSIVDGTVVFKDYEPTNLGILQSWAERDV